MQGRRSTTRRRHRHTTTGRRVVGLILGFTIVLAACGGNSTLGSEGITDTGELGSESAQDGATNDANATIASQIAAFVAEQAPAIIANNLAEVSYVPAAGVEKPRTLPFCLEPESCLHPLTDDAVWPTSVLSIRFLPDADADGVIDRATTNYAGSVDELRNRIDELETRNAWWSTEATRYHGYADSSAPPSMGFEVIGELEFTESPPLGEPQPSSPGVFFPDYDAVLSAAGICDWVDNRGIREVWMYTHHHGDLEPTGSKLSSAIGDISNSFRFDDMPLCANPYTLYNFNFTRDLDVMLLNRAHQIEAMLPERDPELFLVDFVGGQPPFSSPARCGNSHWAPNSVDAFVTWNTESVRSDCANWQPDGGAEESVSCSTWFAAAYGDPTCFADGGVAFYVWWMQSLPGHDNGISTGDGTLSNWWQPLARLETVQDAESWLTS